MPSQPLSTPGEAAWPHTSAATTPDDRRIVLTRVFDAPRTLVWAVWTRPEHVALWWGPAGCSVTGCDIDLRIGGRFRLFMHGPDGTVYPCRAVFRDIVRPERIVYEGAADGAHACGAGLPPRTLITVTFEEAEDGGTKLTLDVRFDTAATGRAALTAGYAPGWAETFDRLAQFVARQRETAA